MSQGKAECSREFFSWIDKFVVHDDYVATKRLFKKAIYLWLLLYTVTLVPYHSFVWGPDSLVVPASFDITHWQDWISRLILVPTFSKYYWLFLIGQIASIILGILDVLPTLSSILVWFFTLNLDNQAWPTLDGGNNLIEILLVYCMFFEIPSAIPRCLDGNFLKLLGTGLSNAAFLMTRIQIAIVYLCAGLAKVSGPLWQKGVALFYILQTQQYSHPWLGRAIIQFPFLFVLATYGTILFQIAFPLLVWYRRPRVVLLLLGCIFHLSIAFVMGLFSFGLAMIVAYMAFLPNECAKKIGVIARAIFLNSIRWISHFALIRNLKFER